MKEFKGCANYTLLYSEDLKDISSKAYVLKHNKTNARIALIQNDDDNKAFIAGFKTPQNNSTGVPHILEHSVLCGSEKYPVKDAMTEVGKGSLNTYMNAFTYPDRTIYPIASCNDKDFQNLLSVYLDAVFYPRLYKEPKIFKQEGWHYELDKLDGELTYNGVVYNEMKGVYSSADQLIASYVLFSLFPDTQYGVESGGDPDYIPDLSYEDFTAFHKKLYHPSNSRIFLYGDMDFEEKLKFIDEEYLSKFDAIEPDSDIKLQKPFDKPVRIEKEYAISENEDLKDATFLTYNVVCSDYTEPEVTEVMSAINYALCTVPGAVLEKRLLDAGIGKNVYSDLVTDTCQKVFSITAQDANPEDEERFINIIEDTIREVCRDGFDKKTLEASITNSEFAFREGDFGYFPKGLEFGMMTFDDWTYTDTNIFSNLSQLDMYQKLRKGINEGLFEKILKERVLDNPHKSIVIMKPSRELTQKKEEALKQKLASYKDTLSKDELKQIIKDTKALKKYQEEPDSEEALATIPTLKLADIDRKNKPVAYEVLKICNIPEIYTATNTNGIAYFSLEFSANELPARLLPAFSILKILLGVVDTKSYSYNDLINEMNIVTGSLSFGISLNKDTDNPNAGDIALSVRCKVFYNKLAEAYGLISEVLKTSNLKDKKRVREVLEQAKIRLQSYMISSGHAVAINRALSYSSDFNKVNEILSGLDQYRYIDGILKDFDNLFEKLVSEMEEVLSYVLKRDNLEISLGIEEKAKEAFDKETSKFIESLPCGKTGKNDDGVKAENLCEGLSCASQVQYVAMTGNYKKAGLPYTGRLQVLRNVLSNDYLWTAIRLQGGAYGCMCGFARNGDSYFVSYRDPNLKKSMEVYKAAADYIKNFKGDEESVERYVITTIGDLDVPLTPSQKAFRAYSMYKSKITNEMKQKERDEILSTDVSKLRELSEYIKAVCDEPYYCTVGGDKILKKEGSVFKQIVALY